MAFLKPEDARSIRNIRMRSGFPVVAVCNSGAQVLSQMGNLSGGLLVCGYRLTDMVCMELHDNMPPGFSMLMVSSPSRWDSRMPEDVVCLPMPLKVHDLVSALEMMAEAQIRRKRRERQQPKQRSAEEKRLLDQAKQLLMERHNGRQSRILHLPLVFQRELQNYLERNQIRSGPVFVTGTGRPLPRSAINSCISQLSLEARVQTEKANPRCLRNMYEETQRTIQSNISLLVEQAYERQLEREELSVGWEE